MAITPNTNIRLLKLPLHLDYKNQLTFASPTAQYNYFNGLNYLEIEECSYQRKNNTIRYASHIDDIITYNYCMYQNENYGNKWFYAFITNMTYINDNMTDIEITTDVYQTWIFDCQFKRSFIEREMINVDDDIPGANLLPESLELGEPVISSKTSFTELKPVGVVAYSGNPKEDGLTTQDITSRQGVIANGIPTRNVFLFCFI